MWSGSKITETSEQGTSEIFHVHYDNQVAAGHGDGDEGHQHEENREEPRTPSGHRGGGGNFRPQSTSTRSISAAAEKSSTAADRQDAEDHQSSEAAAAEQTEEEENQRSSAAAVNSSAAAGNSVSAAGNSSAAAGISAAAAEQTEEVQSASGEGSGRATTTPEVSIHTRTRRTTPVKLRLLSELYPPSKKIIRKPKPAKTTCATRSKCLLSVEEPATFEEANEEESWRVAVKEELDLIEDNMTWSLVDLPHGQKAIGLKWVYKIKKDADGEVVKHKARLVAEGYVQEQGVDFEKVFSPVARMESVRLLITLATQNMWKLHHMDVKSAFLNGELEKEVYVKQPSGFIKEGEEHRVFKLHKALYGLRQAPRAWNIKLDRTLMSLGLRKVL